MGNHAHENGIGSELMAGAMLGVLADLVKLGFNYLAFRFGLAGAIFWRVVAAQFVRAADLASPMAVAIGAVADLTTAALLGTAFLFLLRYTGMRYLWFFGASFGLAAWVMLFGLIIGSKAVSALSLTPMNIMVTPAAHLLFGLALACLARLAVKPRSRKSGNGA